MLKTIEFLEELRRQRLAEPTVRSYEYSLKRFARYLEERSIYDVREVTPEDIRTFLARFREVRRRTRYSADLAMHIERYFEYLRQRGLLFASPAEITRKGGLIEGRFPVLSHSEMSRILDAISGDDPVSVRGKAMLELAYSAALRPRELRDLELADIDRASGVLFIRRSKGDKNRTVPVGQAALNHVDRYIGSARSRCLHAPEERHVFISHATGAPLTTKGVWWAIQEALRRSGQDGLTPYSLRVSAATALLEGGMKISHISRLLGHVRIETTLRYLRVSEAQLTEKLTHYHPRNSWVAVPSRSPRRMRS